MAKGKKNRKAKVSDEPAVPTCHYCQKFYNGKVRKRGGEDEKAVTFRICPVTDKEVTVESPICGQQKWMDKFYCTKLHHWVYVGACAKNRMSGLSECQRCRQYSQDVRYVIESVFDAECQKYEPTPLGRRIVPRLTKLSLIKK